MVARDFKPAEPLKVCGTDVTEFKLKTGDKLYLSPIKDFCSGEILSYTISDSPNLEMVMSMLKGLYQKHPCREGMVLHSDQGWNYQHASYQENLKEHKILQSMSRKGNCIDNSATETFFGTIKTEMWFGHEKEFDTKEELKDAIEEYIFWYNNERIQVKLKGLSPVQFRKQTLEY